jgi:hypothetical protein
MVGHTRTWARPGGFRRAAWLAVGSMIGLATVMTLTLSAQAAGPPITDPNDSRCQRVDPENVFFINLQTPPNGQAVGLGSTIGSWFSDESGLNKNSLSPSLPFHIVFQLDGPSGRIDLPPDISEKFDQSHVFHNGDANKECKIQVNIKSHIPATVNGHPLPAGDYTVTLQAFDDDQTRHPGPDMGTQIWHFSIAAPAPSPSPSPTSQTSPASQTSPVSQVQAVTTTGPGLPNTGHQAGPSNSDGVTIGVLLTLVGLAGIAISRWVRRPKPRST